MKAKENDVDVFIIPSHCSHKIQPLDVAVHSPFETAYAAAVTSSYIHHPHGQITKDDVGKLVKQSIEVALTKENILSGFEATGIHPFNRSRINRDKLVKASIDFVKAPQQPFDATTTATASAISVPMSGEGDATASVLPPAIDLPVPSPPKELTQSRVATPATKPRQASGDGDGHFSLPPPPKKGRGETDQMFHDRLLEEHAAMRNHILLLQQQQVQRRLQLPPTPSAQKENEKPTLEKDPKAYIYYGGGCLTADDVQARLNEEQEKKRKKEEEDEERRKAKEARKAQVEVEKKEKEERKATCKHCGAVNKAGCPWETCPHTICAASCKGRKNKPRARGVAERQLMAAKSKNREEDDGDGGLSFLASLATS